MSEAYVASAYVSLDTMCPLTLGKTPWVRKDTRSTVVRRNVRNSWLPGI